MNLPAWVFEAAKVLGGAVFDLLASKDENEAREVMLQAQEDLKAIHDREKFG